MVPWARGRDPVRQRLGQRAQHHVGDALRGLHVAAGHRRGRIGVDDAIRRRTTWTGRKQPSFIDGHVSGLRQRRSGNARRSSRPIAVMASTALSEPCDDRRRTVEVKGDFIAGDGGGHAESVPGCRLALLNQLDDILKA